ncbi:putative peptide/nitrate transporter [Acorus calamus]|uniref:Peptide/nitrate transporter n=1 Tax=Acorus calamus TaxID=4465 RepID=A0AAV9C7M2_ACOCL|nr:putative peptide/nitrate transporter [Acorus calamus]
METKALTKDGTVDLRGRPVLASRTGRWRACAFLVGYESFERMAFYGIASNLVVYLTTRLHEDTVSSVRSVNNWSGSVWLTPIIGAYIADSYAGRFWTFTISSIIYVLGMIMLTMAVSLKSFKPDCPTTATTFNKASTTTITFFYASLYIIALGAGGTKPNISTFGADQFDDYDPKEKLMKASFFNWWMFSSFLGGLMATLGLVYIQENVGWGIGYGVPTAGLILSLIVFYIGTPNYRHKVRGGENPAWEVVRVWKAAWANRRAEPPEDPAELFEMDVHHYKVTGKRQLCHTNFFRFLDKAAMKPTSTTTTSTTPLPPPPCTVTQVESSKLVLSMSKIWLATLIPSTIWAQANTLFVKQGTTLDRTLHHHFRIPAASLSSFITISMLLSIPFYDRLLVPYLRRRTGNPRGLSLLQRLGVGFAIQTLVTLVAYLVEVKRMHVITQNPNPMHNYIVPMSIFWLLPQYVLLGVGDVFNAIGLLEFFYDQSPETMKSLGTTFFTSGIGMGNFLNSLLVTAVDGLTRRWGRRSWIGSDLNESHLDYYYAFLTVVSVVNVGVFVWVARGFEYKREVDDDEVMLEGKVVGALEMEGKV